MPAGIYNFQQTLEYVALRNLNAALFSVLVQGLKLLPPSRRVYSAVKTGNSYVGFIDYRSRAAQLRPDRGEASNGYVTGILATALRQFRLRRCIYRKVIKRVGTTQQTATAPPVSGLAYTQIQPCDASLAIEGEGP